MPAGGCSRAGIYLVLRRPLALTGTRPPGVCDTRLHPHTRPSGRASRARHGLPFWACCEVGRESPHSVHGTARGRPQRDLAHRADVARADQPHQGRGDGDALRSLVHGRVFPAAIPERRRRAGALCAAAVGARLPITGSRRTEACSPCSTLGAKSPSFHLAPEPDHVVRPHWRRRPVKRRCAHKLRPAARP